MDDTLPQSERHVYSDTTLSRQQGLLGVVVLKGILEMIGQRNQGRRLGWAGGSNLKKDLGKRPMKHRGNGGRNMFVFRERTV